MLEASACQTLQLTSLAYLLPLFSQEAQSFQAESEPWILNGQA